MTEIEYTGYTADDVQRAAEQMCDRTCGKQCKAWGQAVLLFQHGPGAAAALSTMGPVIDRYVIPGVSSEPERG